jgi:hypothetical protein
MTSQALLQGFPSLTNHKRVSLQTACPYCEIKIKELFELGTAQWSAEDVAATRNCAVCTFLWDHVEVPSLFTESQTRRIMLNRGSADLVEIRAYDPSKGYVAYDDDTFKRDLHVVLRPCSSEFLILASVSNSKCQSVIRDELCASRCIIPSRESFSHVDRV